MHCCGTGPLPYARSSRSPTATAPRSSGGAPTWTGCRSVSRRLVLRLAVNVPGHGVLRGDGARFMIASASAGLVFPGPGREVGGTQASAKTGKGREGVRCGAASDLVERPR